MEETNKTFAFKQLEIINLYELPKEVIIILSNPHNCKLLFDMNYPILTTEIEDRERYYTTKSFKYWKDGKTYYVTNDWYKRNRNPFRNWLERMRDRNKKIKE